MKITILETNKREYTCTYTVIEIQKDLLNEDEKIITWVAKGLEIEKAIQEHENLVKRNMTPEKSYKIVLDYERGSLLEE